MKNQKILAVVALVFVVACISGCTEEVTEIAPPEGSLMGSSEGSRAGSSEGEDYSASQELKEFSSTEEIIEYLRNSQQDSSYSTTRGSFTAGADMEDMVFESAAAPGGASMKASVSTQTADEYSQTNVQVKGVDEADFVKNDGKYIYVLTGDKLNILDAYPPEDSKLLSTITIEGSASEMFVNGDKLVVLGNRNEPVYTIQKYDYVPRRRYSARTHVYVYDIEDRENPELLKDFNVNGYYFESRMIDDYVYFIAKENIYYYNNYVDVPLIREGSKAIISPRIYYFDNPEQNYVFHTVASLDLDDMDVKAKSFMMGYSNNLYVSKGNIYVSYQKSGHWLYYREANKKRFFDVIMPLLPKDVRDDIEDADEDWNKIASILEDMYNDMEEDDKGELIEEIEDAVEEYDAKQEMERRKTVIQKIAIDDGRIKYEGKGEVMGYLLNQFSMDEYDENLRVATTVNIWTKGGRAHYNNVYVLDEDMEQIGELEDIAPGESIYSTRFMGDRLYMVTFKRIDPFFVVDMSNPKKPKILGELKIPGYSDYLHPYDEDHVIGIGKETEENEWGGISTGGVKLALFDVSDVEEPKQVDKYEIGETGTDSEALHEHKAFLFDKEKNVLVIPIREVTGRYKDGYYGYYRDRIWLGAYVFGLSPKDGFEFRGKVSHSEDEDDDYYYGSPYAVRRSLYMDDTLYTVSQRKVLMNDLEDLDEIKEVELKYSGKDYEEPKPLIDGDEEPVDGDEEPVDEA